MNTSSGGYRPPEAGVRLLLSDHALSHSTLGPTVHQQIRAVGKFHTSRKGRIRVNKEVLVILKQVSAELDAAQRHYLAHKQYGEAAESILKHSPSMVILPGEASCTSLEATQVQGEAACNSVDVQSSSTDAAPGQNTHAAEAEHLQSKPRRWGHFPHLSRLRAVSVRRSKPPHAPIQLAALEETGAAAAHTAANIFQHFDCVPDSPTVNWMQLLKQKKKAREEGIAHMIRVQHAVLVIQRAWRGYIKRRASKTLAMMLLRTKVRRAHRAAYVANLLKRKVAGAPGEDAGDGGSVANDGDDGQWAQEGAQDQDHDVQLTPQEQAEFGEVLQHTLDEDALGLADVAELLIQQTAGSKSRQRADLASSEDVERRSSEHNRDTKPAEEDEQTEPRRRMLNRPTVSTKRTPPPKLDVTTPRGGSWQGSLRTSSSALLSHRHGSPNHVHEDSSSQHSTPRSRHSSRHSSRRQRLSSGRSIAVRICSGGDTTGGSHQATAASPIGDSDRSPCRSSSVSALKLSRSMARGDMDAEAAADGDHALHRNRSGVSVRRGMSVVLARTGSAVAVAQGNGSVFIRAKSAARQAYRARSRLNPAAVAAVAADEEEDDKEGYKQLAAHEHRDAIQAESEADTAALSGAVADSRSMACPAGLLQDSAPGVVAGDQPSSSQSSQLIEIAGHTGSNGVSLSLKQLQEDPPQSAMPATVVGAISAAAAAQAAVVAAGPAETSAARGVQPDAPDGHEQQQQQQCVQNDQEQLQQRCLQQYFDRQYKQYSQQCEECQLALDKKNLLGDCNPAAADAADAVLSGDDAVEALFGAQVNVPKVLDSRETGNSLQAAGRESSNLVFVIADSTSRQAESAAELALSQDPLSKVDHLSTELQFASYRQGADFMNDALFAKNTTASYGAVASRKEGDCEELQQGSSALPADRLQAYPLDGNVMDQRASRSVGVDRQLEGGAVMQVSTETVAQAPAGSTSSGDQTLLDQVQAAGTADGRVVGMLQQPSASTSTGGVCRGHCVQSQGSAEAGKSAFGAYMNPGDSSLWAAGRGSITDHASAAAAAAAHAAALQRHHELSAVTAAAASGFAHAAVQGYIIGADGNWQQKQQQQQQQQQQSKVDGWYARLKEQGKLSRQPWGCSTTCSPSSSGDLKRGSSHQEQGLGLGSYAADMCSNKLLSGKCGLRSNVHDAWLFIDGCAVAALPWQALAAATAAGATGGVDAQGSVGPQNAAAAAAAAAAEKFMGLDSGHLQQLTAQGRRMMVKLMWLKSLAGVLRGCGRDAGRFEHRMMQLLRKQTGAAGQQLLLWSVLDHKQQQQSIQQIQQGQRRRQQQYEQAAGPPIGVGCDGALLGCNLPLLPAARPRALSGPFSSSGAAQQHQQKSWQVQRESPQQQMLQLQGSLALPAGQPLIPGQQQQQTQQPFLLLEGPHAHQQHAEGHWQQEHRSMRFGGSLDGGAGSLIAGSSLVLAHRAKLTRGLQHRRHSQVESLQGRSVTGTATAVEGSCTSSHSHGGSCCGQNDSLLESRQCGPEYDLKQADDRMDSLGIVNVQLVRSSAPVSAPVQTAASCMQDSDPATLMMGQTTGSSTGRPQQLPAAGVPLLASWPGRGSGAQGQVPGVMPAQTSHVLAAAALQMPSSSSQRRHMATASCSGVLNTTAGLNEAVGLGAGDESDGHIVSVSFVPSTRYQQQCKAQRRKSDGCWEQINMAADQQQQRALTPVLPTSLRVKLGAACAPSVPRLPAISGSAAAPAAAIRSADGSGVSLANNMCNSSGVVNTSSPARGTLPTGSADSCWQQQSRKNPKHALKASFIGAAHVDSQATMMLMPGSLQAFIEEQQQQRERYQHGLPSLYSHVHSPLEQQNTTLDAPAGNVAATAAEAAPSQLVAHRSSSHAGSITAHGKLPYCRRSVEGDQTDHDHQAAVNRRRTVAGSVRHEMQWQGHPNVVGPCHGSGGAAVRSCAQPHLPQLAALRVSVQKAGQTN